MDCFAEIGDSALGRFGASAMKRDTLPTVVVETVPFNGTVVQRKIQQRIPATQ